MNGSTGRGSAIGVLRRNPAFARMYLAQLVSFGGDWFATVALLGLVLDLTRSPTLAGLVIAVQLLPSAIAGPLAGVVVDRFDRRLVMIAADVLRALLVLGVLLARTRGTLWIAFVCVALMSAIAAFFDPASSAALPNLVRDEDLPTANVLIGSAWGTMLAVGAAIGGAVVAALGRNAGFIGDSASFWISALLLTSIRAPFHATDAPRREGKIAVVADVREMLRFARAERRVASLLIVKAGFGLSAGVLGLIAVMAKEVFGSGDAGIGALMSARGAGALVGPFLFRRVFGTDDRDLFRAIVVAFAVFGIGYVVFASSPALWVAAVGAFIGHLGGGAQWTMSSIGLQRFSPDHIRGRVFAADYMLVSLTIGGSVALAGALADRFGPRPVALGLSALAIAWSIAWTLVTRSSWPANRTPAGTGTVDA